MEAYYASETMAVEKELQKRKERCLKRWKKLIIGLRLRSRLQGEYKGGKGAATATGKGKTGNGKEEEGVSQFQPLAGDDAIEKAAPASGVQPPDSSATQDGFIHLDKIDAGVPGGAAFPVIATSPGAEEPKVDVRSLNLPPMPAPAGQERYRETDLDMKMYPANGIAEEQASTDLDDFTLAEPDEIADGGEDVRSADENAVGGGGFMHEEDEEAEQQYKAKDFAQTNGDQPSDADMVEVAPSSPKKRVKVAESASPEESESGEEEADEAADYKAEPIRKTRAMAPRTRATRAIMAPRNDDEAAEAEQGSRRSKRTARKTNAARSARAPAARSLPARPTRAAARKAIQSNVMELDSNSSED